MNLCRKRSRCAGPVGRARIIWFATAAMATATCALWRSSSSAGAIEYLGRDGVFFQRAATDCGGAALKMIFDRMDIAVEYGLLMERLPTGPQGTAMSSMKELAEFAGLLCAGWRLRPDDLSDIPLPAILLLRPRHFVVVEAVRPSGDVLILDPLRGRLRVPVRRLLADWKGESLLFIKPENRAGPHGRWFADSRPLERRVSE
jgi:ABC-type bacteriocin/lantibiotic exporter with double-glycine peptidase domain